MTSADLIDLLAAGLARQSTRGRPHWVRVLGRVRVYSRATHPSCNWEIEPSGSVADVEAANRMIDRLRPDHPFLHEG